MRAPSTSSSATGAAMSASGARYANKDETFVFWNEGDTAFVTEGKDRQGDLFGLRLLR